MNMQANSQVLNRSNKEWINANSKDYTINEMAEKLGTYSQLVSSYCNYYELPRKKSERKPRTKKEPTKSMIESELIKTENLNSKLSEIVEGVSKSIGYTIDEIKSKSRKHRIVVARQICYFIAVKDERFTLKDIGQFLGGRDHSTVIHGINTIIGYRDTKYQIFLQYMEAINKYAPQIHSILKPIKVLRSNEPCAVTTFEINKYNN